MTVSQKPPTRDRQRKTAGQPKMVNMAIISESGGFLSCSCGGFATKHDREKIRGDQAQRHLDKRHNGQGIWL